MTTASESKPIMAFLNHKAFLIIELFVLAIVIPTIIITQKLAPKMFSFLWGTTLYCIIVYLLTSPRDLNRVWNWPAVNWQTLRPIVLRWAAISVALLGFTWLLFPEKLFMLQRERPEILAIILFAYPILSALPQEFIFCTFFFKRYEIFFGADTRMLLASAIVFAYAHVLFINWVAPTLSLIAGLIFAHTYQTKQSLSLVTIEHALYGNTLFFIGLGWFFWGGSISP